MLAFYWNLFIATTICPLTYHHFWSHLLAVPNLVSKKSFAILPDNFRLELSKNQAWGKKGFKTKETISSVTGHKYSLAWVGFSLHYWRGSKQLLTFNEQLKHPKPAKTHTLLSQSQWKGKLQNWSSSRVQTGVVASKFGRKSSQKLLSECLNSDCECNLP